MAYKVIEDFLTWTHGEILEEEDLVEFVEHIPAWLEKGHIKDMDILKKEEALSVEAQKKLDDLRKDLSDDGKLNNSHDPDKKSPGRKPAKKKKKKSEVN